MKTLKNIFIATFALSLFLTSCSKEEILPFEKKEREIIIDLDEDRKYRDVNIEDLKNR